MDVPKYIHVRIGLTDAVYPVRQFITDGLMHDMYEFQVNPTTIGWTHKQWCTPCLAEGTSINAAHDDTDTDWRAYLKSHWDNERNHLRADCLDEFYAIFRRAAAAYINKQNHEQDKSHHQSGAHEPRRTDALLHPSGRRRPATALSAGDKTEVRETGRQMKTVQLSLFPDL